MKQLIGICASLIFTAIALLPQQARAQSPDKLSYQAIIRDGSNALVTSTSVGIQISILQGSASGTAVYVERHFPNTNTNGLVSMEIGAGTVVNGNFTAIDWSAGPYFVKTETDPTGGANYAISGTSQLISVPYALHAKTAETVTGGITETDPVFGASVSSGITGADTTNWNLDNDPTNELQQMNVSLTGDTLHLSDGNWVIIPGISGANHAGQYRPGTIHCNPNNPTAVVDVLSPQTGKIWMDRNLGASQVANSKTDASSYGDLYQWGRFADGHQCRNSSTTSSLSSVDSPGHPSFILSASTPFDWRAPQNSNLWQGEAGVNNPCPTGYRIPTEAEFNSERLTWGSNNSNGAYNSPLKLTLGGSRGGNGSINVAGSDGLYQTSSAVSTESRLLHIQNWGAGISTSSRAVGRSIRCIKD